MMPECECQRCSYFCADAKAPGYGYCYSVWTFDLVREHRLGNHVLVMHQRLNPMYSVFSRGNMQTVMRSFSGPERINAFPFHFPPTSILRCSHFSPNGSALTIPK